MYNTLVESDTETNKFDELAMNFSLTGTENVALRDLVAKSFDCHPEVLASISNIGETHSRGHDKRHIPGMLLKVTPQSW